MCGKRKRRKRATTVVGSSRYKICGGKGTPGGNMVMMILNEGINMRVNWKKIASIYAIFFTFAIIIMIIIIRSSWPQTDRDRTGKET